MARQDIFGDTIMVTYSMYCHNLSHFVSDNVTLGVNAEKSWEQEGLVTVVHVALELFLAQPPLEMAGQRSVRRHSGSAEGAQFVAEPVSEINVKSLGP
jgi:hypothetical protein